MIADDIAADGVAGRAALDNDAVAAIRDRLRAGGIGADIVAGDGIVSSLERWVGLVRHTQDAHAVEGVAGD